MTSPTTTWASRVVPALEDLRDLLGGAGVRSTLSRKELQVPGAWIRPDTIGPRTLAGGGTCRASVLLVAPVAGDAEALADLLRLLERTLTVIDPDDEVDTSIVLPHNGNNLPAFRVVVDLDL